ncbi:hypothetical protein KSP39_PZI014400 [Platanthera zijinensis]|uniref:Uncharacterized protein n=1 Tax=Platanthera zijinensis TaxID=2320716 RepID=A0AAP0BAM7_9ASPA
MAGHPPCSLHFHLHLESSPSPIKEPLASCFWKKLEEQPKIHMGPTMGLSCDHNHEEVDPDELYRSFVLRVRNPLPHFSFYSRCTSSQLSINLLVMQVMVSRSPNIRFQRALNKQSSR